MNITSGNPVFNGWYADPEARIFNGQYWIYPTRSEQTYEEQMGLDAFYSDDLVTWHKAESVLDSTSIPWAWRATWAPSPIAYNGKYYLFFALNDIQKPDDVGGICIAVSDQPEGPFIEALGRPLINDITFGAQPIDPHIFIDDDGERYLYYGGWHHCNVVLLDETMLALKPFEDGEMVKSITPERYVEGPCMLKRRGRYYFMWAEGAWMDADYSVAYAIADSPLGPFSREGVILQQTDGIGTGCGHHGYLQIPGTDEWYIVYHRHPWGDSDPNHRHVCIDHMEFDESGRILPVQITCEGVQARPLK